MYEAINFTSNLRLRIEKDENVGYYLYVFSIGSNNSKEDHLCDNLEQAFLIAKEDYGITKKDFKKL